MASPCTASSQDKKSNMRRHRSRLTTWMLLQWWGPYAAATNPRSVQQIQITPEQLDGALGSYKTRLHHGARQIERLDFRFQKPR
ncbi:hypothetical protein GGR57DRAFT_387947 [Xylariaceae sp. FL1272]|nr:hypothetical protein GGR57DRAFT_387947 [Xylariaceae sp. FL1272]